MSNTTIDISAFTDRLREFFHDTTWQTTAGKDEQDEDRQLLAWTAINVDTFVITLIDGSRFQITVRQTRQANEECDGCEVEVHPDQLTEDGTGQLLCTGCWEALMDRYEREMDVPSEHPYDYDGVRWAS